MCCKSRDLQKLLAGTVIERSLPFNSRRSWVRIPRSAENFFREKKIYRTVSPGGSEVTESRWFS